MSKGEHLQIQVLQLLGQLEGKHESQRSGEFLAKQFQDIVEDFRAVTAQTEFQDR